MGRADHALRGRPRRPRLILEGGADGGQRLIELRDGGGIRRPDGGRHLRIAAGGLLDLAREGIHAPVGIPDEMVVVTIDRGDRRARLRPAGRTLERRLVPHVELRGPVRDVGADLLHPRLHLITQAVDQRHDLGPRPARRELDPLLERLEAELRRPLPLLDVPSAQHDDSSRLIGRDNIPGPDARGGAIGGVRSVKLAPSRLAGCGPRPAGARREKEGACTTLVPQQPRSATRQRHGRARGAGRQIGDR